MRLLVLALTVAAAMAFPAASKRSEKVQKIATRAIEHLNRAIDQVRDSVTEPLPSATDIVEGFLMAACQGREDEILQNDNLSNLLRSLNNDQTLNLAEGVCEVLLNSGESMKPAKKEAVKEEAVKEFTGGKDFSKEAAAMEDAAAAQAKLQECVAGAVAVIKALDEPVVTKN